MGDVRAIYAVGSSLVSWLQHAYDEDAWPGAPDEKKPDCTFQLASSHDLVGTPSFKQGVVFFLYRILHNEHARRLPRDVGGGRGPARLPLDLHYLAFPWVDKAIHEADLLGWTMRWLASRPLLGPADLTGGGFGADETVQIVLGELSTEDLMRVWDAIEPPYRLSVPYVARVVQIDLLSEPEARPVVARKLVLAQVGAPTPEEADKP